MEAKCTCTGQIVAGAQVVELDCAVHWLPDLGAAVDALAAEATRLSGDGVEGRVARVRRALE